MILREQIDRDIYSLYAKLYLVYVQKEKEKKTQKKRKVRKKMQEKEKAMFITCWSKSSLRKVQISSINAFDDNNGL